MRALEIFANLVAAEFQTRANSESGKSASIPEKLSPDQVVNLPSVNAFVVLPVMNTSLSLGRSMMAVCLSVSVPALYLFTF